MVEIDGLTDLEEVGRGGFGVVYRARQAAFRRHVAVKVLTNRFDPATQARFEREGAAMGALSGHPNILAVYGAGTTSDGRAYLLMPYLGRGSLAARLENEGRLPWQDVAAIGVRIAGALETAHAAGILHRDIKPDNILLDDYGEAHVCDFGIARFHGGPGTATTTGHVTASVMYAAPEVLTGSPASPASDVYSLAATLFALLSGRPAFFVDTDTTLVPFFYRVSTQPVPPLTDAGVPPPVAAVITKAMAKEHGERHASAAAFGTALQHAQAQAGVAVTALPLPARMPAGAPPAAQPAPFGQMVDSDQTTSLGGPPSSFAAASPAPAAAAAAPPRGPPTIALPAEPTPARARRSRAPVLAVAGVVVVALIAGGIALFRRDAQQPQDPASPSQPDHYTIRLGDPVEPGVPSVGAGVIEAPGDVDIYEFEGQAQQSAFVDVHAVNGVACGQSGLQPTELAWRLQDPNGQTVDNDNLFDGFCGDAGPIPLPVAGTYQLLVGAVAGDTDDTGTYALQVIDAPRELFQVDVGDTIEPGQPAQGAGQVASAGQVDIYEFQGQAQQSVFVDVQEINAAACGQSGTPYMELAWRLQDPSGQTVDNDNLFDGFCGDAGPIPLPVAGTYELWVGAVAGVTDDTGTYALQVIESPSQLFQVDVGDTIEPGQPAQGAGEVTSAGQVDIYEFEGQAQQSVFVDVQEVNAVACGQSGLRSTGLAWSLQDPSGQTLDSDNLFDGFCGDAGPIPLPVTGTYQLSVGAVAGVTDDTGTYALRLAPE